MLLRGRLCFCRAVHIENGGNCGNPKAMYRRLIESPKSRGRAGRSFMDSCRGLRADDGASQKLSISSVGFATGKRPFKPIGRSATRNWGLSRSWRKIASLTMSAPSSTLRADWSVGSEQIAISLSLRVLLCANLKPARNPFFRSGTQSDPCISSAA